MTTVTRQIHFAIKSRRKIAVPGLAPELTVPVGRTPRVSKLMALAIRFDQILREGKIADQSELARLAHVTQPRMTQIMNLLHLAPNIQEELLHLPPIKQGKDPATERDLRPIARLRDWRRQREAWRSLASPAPQTDTPDPVAPTPESRRLAAE
ncbi:MAG: hypothetical protein JW741_11445 [Sedimentisphaerales bacterium]|nr:hypothetical protein [Sedimentisphaerales bacterium]